MTQLFQPPSFRATDANGDPVSGAKLFLFVNNTTTPLIFYSDAALTTAHPWPLVANSAGVFAPVYTAATLVKVLVTSANGSALPGYPVDNVNPAANFFSLSGALTQERSERIAADNVLQTGINSLASGRRIVGPWDASSGSFPTTRPDGGAIQAGDTWLVSDAGTVDGVAFALIDQLVSLSTGGATYAGNWFKWPDDGFGSATVTPTGGSTARTLAAKLGEKLSAKDFGATGDGTTDDTTAIQAAINAVRNKGGGVVSLPVGVYMVSDTLLVWERVVLEGENGIANNFYSNTDFEERGTVIKLIAGSDTDVVHLVISGNTVGSPIASETNTDRRHMGGVRNLCISGNRSESQVLTAKDLNATGNGLVMVGVNLVDVENVVVLRCADDGVAAVSSAVSDGSCNNLYLSRVYSGLNGGRGFSLAGGDSNITHCWAIYNGLNGITSSLGNSIHTAILANDNLSTGISGTAGGQQFIGCRSYDNHRAGFQIAGAQPLVVGCVAQHNGRFTGLAVTDRVGFAISSTAVDYTIAGCSAYDRGYRGDPDNLTQQYGFRVLGGDGVFDNNYAAGNVIADYSYGDESLLPLHRGAGSTRTHPGFVATGSIDMDTRGLLNLRGLTFDTPVTITTITDNILAATAHTTVTLNVTGGATVNSITGTLDGLGLLFVRNINASSVTFTNGATLKTQSGSNLVLAQNGAATFKEFADGVWFQVG